MNDKDRRTQAGKEDIEKKLFLHAYVKDDLRKN